jgi:hypothetical protein
MKKIILLSSTLFLLGSCATLLRGSKTSEIVKISGNPKEANIYVNNELVGKSPLNYEVKKRKEHIVRIEKEGYKDSNAVIETKLNPTWTVVSLVGNIWTFDLTSIIDLKKGSVNDIVTKEIKFKLQIDSSITSNSQIETKNVKSNNKNTQQLNESEKIISPAVRIRTNSKEYILKYKAAVTVKTKGGLRVASHIIEITPTYMTLKKNNTKIYYTDIAKIKMFSTRRWVYVTMMGAIPWAITAKTAKVSTSNCNKKIVEIKVVNHFDKIEYGKTICN